VDELMAQAAGNPSSKEGTMDWMIMPLRRYAEFTGRSRRKEYWLYVLFLVIVGVLFGMLDTALGLGGSASSWHSTSGPQVGAGGSFHGGVLTLIFWLATLVPSIAVAIRRLHDTDRSGWWLLIGLVPLIGGIVLLVFMLLEGTRGPNRFGPDPRDPAPESVF
jgi:uncharacterized membrane protein YhaH (DUF805 family)